MQKRKIRRMGILRFVDCGSVGGFYGVLYRVGVQRVYEFRILNFLFESHQCTIVP